MLGEKEVSWESENTIVAPATALGGPIGIIRISGKKSLETLRACWRNKGGNRVAKSYFRSHQMKYGYIVDGDENIIDEAMAVYFKSPHSYTKEDVVEIQCHGGFLSMEKILEVIVNTGVSVAEPGEFTKRAFLHGRIDLAQAEAVMEVISANSKRSFSMAQEHLSGKLGKTIQKYRDEMVEIVAHLEAQLDYPEEMEPLSREYLLCFMEDMKNNIRALLDTYDHGKMLADGIKTVILGKPNVGKSSLLNQLLQTERAIVTDIPGTTRDIIEAPLNLFGFPFLLIDTAGVRETTDPIEKIGVEKSLEAAKKADLIILVLDGSKSLESADIELMKQLKDRVYLAIVNKIDLDLLIDSALLETYLDRDRIIYMSVKTEKGMNAFQEKIEDLFRRKELEENQALLISSKRHKQLLEKTIQSIDLVEDGLHAGMPEDILAIDLVAGIHSLGLITGESATEDILDKIFKDFCLGK